MSARRVVAACVCVCVVERARSAAAAAHLSSPPLSRRPPARPLPSRSDVGSGLPDDDGSADAGSAALSQ